MNPTTMPVVSFAIAVPLELRIAVKRGEISKLLVLKKDLGLRFSGTYPRYRFVTAQVAFEWAKTYQMLEHFYQLS